MSSETYEHLFSFFDTWLQHGLQNCNLVLYLLLANVNFVPSHSRAVVYQCALKETLKVQGFVYHFYYLVVWHTFFLNRDAVGLWKEVFFENFGSSYLQNDKVFAVHFYAKIAKTSFRLKQEIPI